MGRDLGDILVREERLLRPSKAFVYLVTGEISPEAYPEFAIEQFHDECRREYRRRLARGRAGFFSRLRADIASGLGEMLIQIVLFNDRLRLAAQASPAAKTALTDSAPRSVAVLRALG
jgi:hypothetical protein